MGVVAEDAPHLAHTQVLGGLRNQIHASVAAAGALARNTQRRRAAARVSLPPVYDINSLPYWIGGQTALRVSQAVRMPIR
jgi:hypothetical protein